MNEFAEVIVNSDAIQVDKPFTYKVGDELKKKIKIGHRVIVSFGGGNKKIEGFVINLLDEVSLNNIRYKNVIKICDEEPLLDTERLKLVKFLRNKYLCKYIDAIRIMIPPKIMSGNKEKTKSVVVYIKEIEGLRGNQKEALKIIKNNNGKFTKTEIIRNFNISTYMLNKLIKLGSLETQDIRVHRINKKQFNKYPPKKLNEEQLNAYDRILDSEKLIFLLKGVTGSGKTEVYMNLVSYMLLLEKTSLILVPEISLTPQMIERFKGRFGSDIAVFHSKLSDGERYDEWYRVKNEEVKLIIGARSALFLPFNNLGLIVVDEEHEGSYKSEMNPKYNTIEICEYLSENIGCKVVLGSATPSLESYYKANKNEYELIELNNRINNSLPDVSIVDMREELKSNNTSIFSRELYNKIKEKLSKKEQIILFLNRRGFSTFVSCRSCGYVFKCDSCEISMTYHKNGYLICHYCGKTKRIVNKCPECGSKYVKYFGSGTEKVEEATKYYFPKARILRMDMDTTRKKNSYEEIYTSFKNEEADILIGTQMVAKGLDFENVTLVGVLAADTTLNLPDFKASEKNFQILTQVSGRAGRGKKRGEVVVQTYNPSHYSIQLSKDVNYNEFFNKEIIIRKAMDYPPFSSLLLINLTGRNEKNVIITARTLEKLLKDYIKNINNIQVYPACSSPIDKINNMYRWQVLIKGQLNDIITNKVKKKVYEYTKDIYNEVKVTLDINPNSLI